MVPQEKTGRRMRRWLIGLLAAIPVAIGLSSWIAFQVLCTFDAQEADYGGLRFHGWRGEYHTLSSFAAEDCQLFLEIPGEGKFPIQAIPQNVLERCFDKNTDEDFHYDTAYDGKGELRSLTLRYKNGELVQVHGEPIAFSRTRGGPNLSFPVSYEDLHKAWGNPDKIFRRRQMETVQYH